MMTTTSTFFAIVLTISGQTSDVNLRNDEVNSVKASGDAPSSATTTESSTTTGDAATSVVEGAPILMLDLKGETPVLEQPASLDAIPVVVDTPAPTVVAPSAPPQAPVPMVMAPHVPRLLVLDLVDKGAGADVTRALTEAVANQAVRSAAGDVVTAQQIAVALDASATQAMLGCESEVCMTDVARRVEAERVLGGSVARVGNDLLITLLVVEVSTANRIAQVQRKVPDHQDLHYYAAKELASLALTGHATSSLVPVAVRATEDGAGVLVDGAMRGSAPLVVELDPGDHEIRVELDGFSSWRTLVSVEEGVPISIEAELVSEGLPLWPAALALLATSAISATGAMAVGLWALERYDGSVSQSDAGRSASYLHGSPVDDAVLVERGLEVRTWMLAANVLWGVAGVLFIGAAAVETADLVFMAVE